MPTPNSAQTGSPVSAGDFVFTMFRHKWKIIFFFLLGVGAAAAVFVLKQPPYTSTAKVLVKYITESKGPDVPVDGEVTRAPEQKNNAIMRAESEIIQTHDLMKEAVQSVGPAKVLAAYGGGSSELKATRIMSEQLKVASSKSGGIVSVGLSHKDPDIAKDVLNELIDKYLRKHVSIHQTVGGMESLQLQTEQARNRVTTLDAELTEAKNRAQVLSLEDSRNEIANETAYLRNQIVEAQAEAGVREAQLALYLSSRTVDTNQGVSTNLNLAAVQPLINQLREYNNQKRTLLGTFAEESRPVQRLQQKIAAVETQLKDKGFDPATIESQLQAPETAKSFDPVAEKNQVARIRAKIEALTAQLDRTQDRAKKLQTVERSIGDLEYRKRTALELHAYFVKNLEKAQFDQAIDSGKANNITLIQAPTLAEQEFTTLYKIMAGVFAGCLAAGLLLAFLIDFVLDSSVKRSHDLEASIGLPVFATVPEFGRNGHSKLRLSKKKANAKSIELYNGEIAPWSESDPMLPYYEAIRDRLVMSYGDDPHKPKIVGVTSCNKGAGVSRLATGLAASLSRDVQRNVLLIGLDRDKVAVSAFGKGQPTNGEDLQEQISHPHALVQQDLQALVATGRNRNGASVVQSFTELMPKLKVADYDYIVFDLPPISQTSGSLRLASQMERTVLVVEGEETSKDRVKKVKSLLGNSRTQLVTVLNKVHSYGPKALNGE